MTMIMPCAQAFVPYWPKMEQGTCANRNQNTVHMSTITCVGWGSAVRNKYLS